ncbi:hypothetical protein [Pararhodobacter sp. SW119]|uniref:hypothetical protein n=1 Tax=Pararhodobacter sp. SW119 TaxID=2780075 RepID=UPI001AE06C47|nr:hypothetical protein [Pararhodobacter sp. SW119]
MTIDDPGKTQRLLAEMKALLPLEARLSPNLSKVLSKQAPGTRLPARCMVTEVFYMGDEGGITCRLDIGGPDSSTPFIVSMTHLDFDRRSPLFRQIDSYCRHRVKKLRKHRDRGF